MKLRCSQCRKAWIDPSVRQCPACGFVLGTEINEAALLMVTVRAPEPPAPPSPAPQRSSSSSAAPRVNVPVAAPPRQALESRPDRNTLVPLIVEAPPAPARPAAPSRPTPAPAPSRLPAAAGPRSSSPSIPAAPPAAPVAPKGVLTGLFGEGAVAEHGTPELVPNAKLEGLDLAPEQGYVLTFVDGASTVDDIVAASGMTVLEAAAHLGVLAELGLIRFRPRTPKRTPDAVALPPEPTPAPRTPIGRMEVKHLSSVDSHQAETDPTMELEAANLAREAGNLEKAREHAKAAWVIAPDNVRVLMLDKQLNDPSYAKQRAKALHDLGAEAQKNGDMGLAVEFYRRALKEYEPSAALHHKLGLALVHARASLEDAEHHMARAVELAPDNTLYAENLARIQNRTRKQG